MTKFFILSGLVLALSAAAVSAQPVPEQETGTEARLKSGLVEVTALVERALVEPVKDLERKARTGFASDKLVYGLALKAGRGGAGQDENAQKWIKKARNSFERPSSNKSSNGQVMGGAAQPVRDLENKRYAGGQAVTTAPVGGSSGQSYIAPSFPAKMNPDTILVAEACMDALLLAPDPKANVAACGGEVEYQRLVEVMWTSAAKEAMREIVGYVDAALTQPVAQLERRAKSGSGRDKLVYGLALKAGRMGPDGVKTADEWIERARREYEASGTTVISGSASAATTQETDRLFGYDWVTRHAGGRSTFIPGVVITRTGIQPLWIDIAAKCVDALGVAEGTDVDMAVCGGETEYRRLRTLMPKT